MQETENKNIAVLGSTGSVGEQALDVAARLNFTVSAISAARNVRRLEEQARRFHVRCAAMADESAAKELKLRLADTDTEIFAGADGICEMIAREKRDVAVNSIIGKDGLLPTLAVIDSGARLALANKESLVVAGEIVTRRAKERGVEILPVDSEHSAIFQCLKAGKGKEVKKILLTASGGPFFGYTPEMLRGITREQALAHPTWKMGAKITIDSATLMNKGFEVIEAVHLFRVPASAIQVVVHRESIIHSMVEYIDNSVIAQLSTPDMRLCAEYAVTYPDRVAAVIPELDFYQLSSLSFAKPDPVTFPLLQCAIDAIACGGALPAVLNAANEVAVAAFLAGKISFAEIAESVCAVTAGMKDTASGAHMLEEILTFDREARLCEEKLLKL